MITLWGATGALGKSIADALDAEGREYRVVGRDRASLEKAYGKRPLARLATWNPDDPASARAAMKGTDTVVYLIGVPYHQFHLHPVVMQKTLDAAVAEGVPKMLLIGTIYPYGRVAANPVDESHPRNPHTYKGRMRKEQEDLLLNADAAGKIRGTVLRLPDFYGPGVEKSFLDGLFKAAGQGGMASMIGPIDTPHEFVFILDVGPVVTRLIANDGAWGHVWHFGGPGVATQRDLAERTFKMAGRKPRILVAGKTLLRLIGLFDPLMKELVEMNYLQTDPVWMDDSAIHRLLGPLHKTSWDEGLRLSLLPYQKRSDRLQ